MGKKYLTHKNALLIALLFISFCLPAQEPGTGDVTGKIDDHFYNLRHRLDILEKKIDDVLWFERVGDIAHIDKVFLAGAPLRFTMQINSRRLY